MGGIFSSMRLLVVVGGGPKAGKSLFMRRLRDITARGLSSDSTAVDDNEGVGSSISSSSDATTAANHSAAAASCATLLHNVVKTSEAVLDYEAPVVAIRCVEVPSTFRGCNLLGGGGDSGAFTSFMAEGRQWDQVAAVVWVVDLAILRKFDAAWAHNSSNNTKENESENDETTAVGLSALMRLLEAVDDTVPLEIVVRGGFPSQDSDEAINLALRVFAPVLPRRTRRRPSRPSSTTLDQPRDRQDAGEQQAGEGEGEQSNRKMIDNDSGSTSDVLNQYAEEYRSEGYICSNYDHDDNYGDDGDDEDDDDEEEGGRQGALEDHNHDSSRRKQKKKRPWSVVHTANWGSGAGRGGLPPALLWLQRALLQSS